MKAYQILIAITVILVVLSALVLMNKFLSNRFFNILKNKFPNINYTAYLVFFWVMTSSIWIAFFTREKIPFITNEFILNIGLIWAVILPVMFVMELVIIAVDKLIKRKGWSSNRYIVYAKQLYKKGVVQFLVAVAFIIYGIHNAFNISVVEYNLTTDKKADVDNLNIVFLADTHGFSSGIFKDNSKTGLAHIVNSLNPDLVLLGGDLIDELSQPSKIENVKNELRKIESKYGTYGVLGNHDYRADTDIAKFFEDSNVTLLKDSYIEVAGVYIVGSDYHEDGSQKFIQNLNNLDNNKPIIYIKHVPNKKGESYDEKIDLQLSGHTHRGQVSPGNTITSVLFSNHYGYKKFGTTHSITTSGFGVWGPKVRVGSKGEILKISIKFNQ